MEEEEKDMKFLIQRVKSARVCVQKQCVGEIKKGLLVFVGIGEMDTKEKADDLIRKLTSLRIFEDEKQKMNLSISQVQGELLLISQFTLYADCSHGNRPSFTHAGEPEKAKGLYEYIVEKLKQSNRKVETGIFGAMMEVELINDGPVTIMLEK